MSRFDVSRGRELDEESDQLQELASREGHMLSGFQLRTFKSKNTCNSKKLVGNAEDFAGHTAFEGLARLNDSKWGVENSDLAHSRAFEERGVPGARHDTLQLIEGGKDAAAGL